jgi:hypothetical protein
MAVGNRSHGRKGSKGSGVVVAFFRPSIFQFLLLPIEGEVESRMINVQKGKPKDHEVARAGWKL